MAVTSNTMKSAAGNISVTIKDATTTTMELVSVGDIVYKYDINDVTKDTINEVPTVISNVSITARDKLADGRLLSKDVLDVSNIVDLTIGGYLFPLRYRKGEFDIDDIGGNVTFEAFPSRLYDLSPTEATFNVVQDDDQVDSYDVTPIGQAIEEKLDEYGGSGRPVIIRSDHFTDTDVPSPSPGDPSAQWGVQSSTGDIANDFLNRLAKVEGAFWGVGFDTNFYISRKSTLNNITITQDDILDISRDINYPDLKEVIIDFNNTGSTFSHGLFDVTDSNRSVDPDARQVLDITSNMPEMIRYFYDDVDARLESDTPSNSQTAALAVTNDGLDNYERVLRGNAPFEVTLTVEGFDTIKPWETFDITDTTGKLDAYTGRTYRPSQIAYSIDNTITITAYALS